MPRPAVPFQPVRGTGALGVLVMALNMRPWLDEPPPYYHPKHNHPRVGQVLAIAVAVGLVGFLVALITAIVTAGGG
jgi:hypothetical protein